MAKAASNNKSALKNLDTLARTQSGREIAQEFGAQIGGMKLYDGIRLSRLLEAAFNEGKKVGAAEMKESFAQALKKLS